MQDLIGILVAAALVLQTAPAVAQPNGSPPEQDAPDQDDQARDDAKRLVLEGAALFDEGDQLGALRKFEEAYKAYPAPEIFYNLGITLRALGRNALAHRALTRFLAESTRDTGDRRDKAQKSLADLEQIVGKIHVDVPGHDGALVSIDGVVVGVAPLGYSVAVEPAVHEVSASADDEVIATERVAVGQASTIDVVLEKKIPTPEETARTVDAGSGAMPIDSPRRASPVYKKWWFWTGVGVVVLGAAAVTIAVLDEDGGDMGPPSLGRFPFDEF